MEVDCCTENGRALKHVYGKICFGAAFEASGGVGCVSNSDGKSCSKPPKNMLGGEIGASWIHAGAEASATVDMGGGGVSVSGGSDIGVGLGPLGLGFKATACYYRYLITRPSNSKCDCKIGE